MQLCVLECISYVYYKEKSYFHEKARTVCNVLDGTNCTFCNLYSHTWMCVCKLLFFSFLPDHFTESTLQMNTICSNIYAFGCSLNVRQKERSWSRSVVDKLLVCWIVLCCFIYIFFLFYSSACSVFTGISNPAVLALKQLWKFALFMD